jgi:hypothetical protein
MKTFMSAACLFAVLIAAPAGAGEIAEAAKKAEELAAAGQHRDAIDTLSNALSTLWAQSPLIVRKAVFVAGEPAGYGIYQPRPDSTFKRAEPLVIYAEPVGYGYTTLNGVNTIELVMDFAVAKRPGAVVAEQKAFGVLKLDSLEKNREFFAKVTYDFSGLPAGDYDVTTTLTDKATAKSSSFTLPFTLTD